MWEHGDAIPTQTGAVRRILAEISFRVHDKNWLFENISLVRECFPHLEYIDATDMELRLQSDHGVIVAECRGKPVGFTVWYETLPGIAYIWLTGVAREQRGKGIGTVLRRTAIRELSKRGMRAVWCKISKEKTGWIKKHLEQGFRIVEHVREDGKDLYKLAKVFRGDVVIAL
ncbi:MAG: Acetyltransferase family [Candidatus Diapherotrites archaeon]|nr:Acetyltransferase family [Candidatus Diapherotrites archaeon]MDN5366969.1 Acetyltransferase family [Candidatus Diapherotrites archaeon]